MKPAATNRSSIANRELDPWAFLVFVGILACILSVNVLAFFAHRGAASLRDLLDAVGRDVVLAACVFAGLTGSAMVRYVRQRRQIERMSEGRCAECGYNLTGNVSGVCPECGCRA